MVEAQVSGLKCLISDAITKEVDITELVHRMSLADTAEEWTIAAMQMLPYERKSHLEEVNAAGFSIREQAKDMKNCTAVNNRENRTDRQIIRRFVPWPKQAGYERN